jgi:hypothetical protein
MCRFDFVDIDSNILVEGFLFIVSILSTSIFVLFDLQSWMHLPQTWIGEMIFCYIVYAVFFATNILICKHSNVSFSICIFIKISFFVTNIFRLAYFHSMTFPIIMSIATSSFCVLLSFTTILVFYYFGIPVD